MTKLKTMMSVMLIIGRNQGWDWRCPKHFGCGGVWVQNPSGIIKTRRDTTNYTNYGCLSFTPPSRQRWCWCWPKLWIVFSCWVESRQIQKREKRRACYYFWPPYAGLLGNLSVHFVLYRHRVSAWFERSHFHRQPEFLKPMTKWGGHYEGKWKTRKSEAVIRTVKKKKKKRQDKEKC